jgi:hypothetical protein
MEYDPDFFSVWNPDSSTFSGISRAATLERYTAVLGDAPKQPVFEDIVELTIALDPISLQDAVDFARALEFDEDRSNGQNYVFSTTDFVLHVGPVTESGRGVRKMVMRISRAPEQKEHRLGKSILVFGDDNLARWTF